MVEKTSKWSVSSHHRGLHSREEPPAAAARAHLADPADTASPCQHHCSRPTGLLHTRLRAGG